MEPTKITCPTCQTRTTVEAVGSTYRYAQHDTPTGQPCPTSGCGVGRRNLDIARGRD